MQNGKHIPCRWQFRAAKRREYKIRPDGAKNTRALDFARNDKMYGRPEPDDYSPLILAEYFCAECPRFRLRSIRFDRDDDVRHEICPVASGDFHVLERIFQVEDRGGAQGTESFDLLTFERFVNAQRRDEFFFFDRKAVYSHHNGFGGPPPAVDIHRRRF